jgi:hypothetical protein
MVHGEQQPRVLTQVVRYDHAFLDPFEHAQDRDSSSLDVHLRSEADPALNSIMSLSSGTDQRPRRPATTLIVVAITAIPNTYDNKAWRRAVLRIRLDERSVSET